jgi:hypothetical protein
MFIFNSKESEHVVRTPKNNEAVSRSTINAGKMVERDLFVFIMLLVHCVTENASAGGHVSYTEGTADSGRTAYPELKELSHDGRSYEHIK